MIRPTLLIACTALVGTASTACSFSGVNSRPLPFTEGRGPGSTTVTVEMANAANLVPNSEVKVNDVTVGSVRRIEFAGWHARLTVGLNQGTVLPANAVARIGQKSLLGAEYLELAPPSDTAPRGRLTGGATIPLSRSGRYPQTEEVLSALSLVLNGGGLQHIQTITRELNKALGGREDDVRALLENLDTLVGGLNAQRHDLVRLLTQVQRLGSTLAAQRQTIVRALDAIPPGLGALEEERADLVRALEAVSDFGEVADQVLTGSRDKLAANLRDLRPVLRELADAGRDLPESLGILLSVPFPIDRVLRAAKGDYFNIFAVFDLTLSTLDRNFLTGTPLAGLLAGGGALQPDGPGTDAADPWRAPLEPPEPKPSQPSRTGRGTATPSPAPSVTASPSPSSSGERGSLGDLLNPGGR